MTIISSPNPMNRRIVDRSFMIRLSSCPDSHFAWKLQGRRCSFAYRSSLTPVSEPSVPIDMIHRRTNARAPSTRPRPSARKPSASTP